MKVEIEGYRNIEKLEYEITDNKINMLFGVSGSGKSSIAMAIRQEDRGFNRKVDFLGDTKILINGAETDNGKVMVFDSKSVDKYIREEDDGTVFNILIDDENELAKEQEKFDKYMIRFRNVIATNEDRYTELKKISTDLVGKLSLKGEIRASAKIKKLEENLSGKSTARIVSEMNAIDPDRLEWIIEGSNLLEEDHECPFCLKKMSKKRISKVKRYSEFDTKNLKLVRDKISKFSELGIKKPTYTQLGIKRLSDEMGRVAISVREFEKIKDIIDDIDNEKQLENIKEIAVEIEIYDYFPDLRYIIRGLNKNLDNIRNKTKKLNSATKSVLLRRTSEINKQILSLGIPYQIEIKYKKNKINSYKLKLNTDGKEEDRKKSLSTGERNLIAFLIFTLDVKKNGNDKLCIIDDPISSYDEHRRKLIYDHIKKNLRDATVLMLSHDSVFARIAAYEKSKKVIGSINYFDNNNGDFEFIEITKDDFKKFDDFIIERVNESDDYYQKIINLRMLYEGGRSHVYNYLSKVLHFESEENMHRWLTEIKKTEEYIIEEIFSKNGVSVPKYEEGLLTKIAISNYSLLERAALAREQMPRKASCIRNELNHIIHVGDRQIVCLNPHKYSFCSNRTKNQVDLIIDKLIS